MTEEIKEKFKKRSWSNTNHRHKGRRRCNIYLLLNIMIKLHFITVGTVHLMNTQFHIPTAYFSRGYFTRATVMCTVTVWFCCSFLCPWYAIITSEYRPHMDYISYDQKKMLRIWLLRYLKTWPCSNYRFQGSIIRWRMVKNCQTFWRFAYTRMNGPLIFTLVHIIKGKIRLVLYCKGFAGLNRIVRTFNSEIFVLPALECVEQESTSNETYTQKQLNQLNGTEKEIPDWELPRVGNQLQQCSCPCSAVPRAPVCGRTTNGLLKTFDSQCHLICYNQCGPAESKFTLTYYVSWLM